MVDPPTVMAACEDLAVGHAVVFLHGRAVGNGEYVDESDRNWTRKYPFYAVLQPQAASDGCTRAFQFESPTLRHGGPNGTNQQDADPCYQVLEEELLGHRLREH